MRGFRFTDDVRAVLATAREEASRLNYSYVGTEHILLALTARDTRGVARTREKAVVSSHEIRRSVERVVKPGTAEITDLYQLPYTMRAKRTLELAMIEARECQHSFVGVEHLLLGLMRERKGLAAQVLGEHGISADAVRAALLEEHPRDPALAAAPRSIRGKHVLVMTVLWAAFWVMLQPDVLTWRVLVLLLVIFVPPVLLMFALRRGRRGR